METVAAERQTKVENYFEEEEYVKSEDPYLMAMLNDENVLKRIKSNYEFELIDTHAALPIIIDLHHLETRGVDMNCVGCFVDDCYNKHTLEIYDHPADPRIAGYFHLSESIDEFFRQFFDYAFNWYHENHPEGKTKQFKEMKRMSCSPDCHPFYYMTFTVVDELTKEEVTLQALVIQFAIGDLQLGMLRDSSHDRVLAAIRFKGSEGLTGKTRDQLKTQLVLVWESVMMKDDEKDSC